MILSRLERESGVGGMGWVELTGMNAQRGVRGRGRQRGESHVKCKSPGTLQSLGQGRWLSLLSANLGGANKAGTGKKIDCLLLSVIRPFQRDRRSTRPAQISVLALVSHTRAKKRISP